MRAGDAELITLVTAFGEQLRGAGVPVTPERSARFATALINTAPDSLEEVYWIGRTTLLSDREQFAVFDRVFDWVFRGVIDLIDSPVGQPLGDEEPAGGDADRATDGESGGDRESVGPRGTSATPGGASDGGDDSASVLAAASVEERLNHRDFSALTAQELALIQDLVERLPLVPPLRTGRRTRRSRSGDEWDVRATLRRAHRTGGDPVRRIMRARTEKPRRVVLLADVSGSMEPYARIYLHLMRGAVRAVHAEAFVFATHLTRLTPALDSFWTDIAYRKAAEMATDWSGGTRIGRALHEFLDRFGRRGMARGAVLVIVSDGWEVDDPTILGRAMERLSRLAHHVIWVNPRKAAEGYAPLVGGMAAALPYVDTFVSGHSLAALQDVMAAIHAAGDHSVSRAARVA